MPFEVEASSALSFRYAEGAAFALGCSQKEDRQIYAGLVKYWLNPARGRGRAHCCFVNARSSGFGVCGGARIEIQAGRQ